MKLFHNLLMVTVITSIIGCKGGNETNPTYSKFSHPDTVLNYFFEACASMDSVVIDSLSIVTNYPLVTEWKIRRIAKQSKYLSFSEMKDSANVFKNKMAELNTNMKSLRDNINHNIITSSTVNEKFEKYEQAELAWENSEMERIQGGFPENYKSTKELEKKKDTLEKECLAFLEYYNEIYPKTQKRLKHKLSVLETQYFEYIELQLELLVKIAAIKKSGIALNSPSSLQTCSIHAFVDLKLASKLGMMLNKKARVELFSADCTNKQAKWIITDITYLGE